MENLLTNLKAILATTPVRLNSLVSTVPEDLLRRKPASSEWSALDVLQHLIDVEKGVFPVRIKAVLAGKTSFPGFFPEKDGSGPVGAVTPESMAAEFASLRAENLKLLDTLTEADLARKATHSELGLVSLGELLHEWGGHDLMHLVQAEQAMMQPFIQGSGAWLGYFVKHIASV